MLLTQNKIMHFCRKMQHKILYTFEDISEAHFSAKRTFFKAFHVYPYNDPDLDPEI